MRTSAEMVRAKLDTALLPAEPPTAVSIGHGTGDTCAVCEQPILEVQAQYEAHYDHRPTIRFHARCHFLWRAELRGRRSSVKPRS